jgi:hypothetical protein
MNLPKAIAVDFDGTLCEDAYPSIGAPIQSTIDAFFAEQAAGTKFILNTCREGKPLTEALMWCTEQGIVFYAINENLPERIAYYGGDCRKISADEYWDDRARQMPERTCRWWFTCDDCDLWDTECDDKWHFTSMPKFCPSCGLRTERAVIDDD